MKNLKRMYINNFQSHKDTRIEFSNNITTFVGPSDSGKTSIFRALELVIKNMPRGVDYITVGETKTTVGVMLEDDSEVVRERTKSVNRYILYNPDGTSVPLEGFGVDVPPDILETLDYQPIKVDTDLDIDLNFSKQLEGPFLLSENDASKAKTIDGLAKINVFNIALRNTNRKITNLNSEIRNIDTQLDTIQEDLKQYKDLDDLEKTLESLSEVINRLEELESSKKLYETLFEQYKQVDIGIRETVSLINSLKPIIEADSFINQVNTLFQKRHLYLNLFNNYQEVVKSVEETNKTLEYKDNIIQLNDIIHNLEGLNSKKTSYNEFNNAYLDIVNKIGIGNNFIKELSPIIKVGDIMTVLERKQQQKNVLTALWGNLHKTTEEVNQQEGIIKKLSGIRDSNTYLEKITNLLEYKSKLSTLNNSLIELDERIDKGVKYKADLIEKVEEQKENYTSLLNEFNKCPVCFTELDENHMHDVIQSI